MQALTSTHEQEQTSGTTDRAYHDKFSSGAPSKSHGSAKRGGRPVTWIGGGGLDPKTLTNVFCDTHLTVHRKLAGLGVPVLRELFLQVFGENTASNNAGWLRRKLSESPDSVHGQCRSRVVRARDSGAAIWNRPLVMMAAEDEAAAAAAAGLEEEEGQGEAGGSGLLLQGKQEADVDMTESAGALQQGPSPADASSAPGLHACGSSKQHHRSLKRSCTEASETLRDRAAAARCQSSSASDSGSPAATHQDGSVSPRVASHAQQRQHRHHGHHGHRHHKQHPRSGSQHGGNTCGASGNSSGACPGQVIRPENLADGFVGMQVLVYWPADNKWWEATICGLNIAGQQLQLLYSDQTEELLAGQDFQDLLCNGHLALVAGQAVPPSSTSGYTVSGIGAAAADQAAPAATAAAATACDSPMLLGQAPSGLQDASGSGSGTSSGLVRTSLGLSLTSSGLSGPSGLAAAAASSDADTVTRRLQGCQLPANIAGSGSKASIQEFAGSTSASFGVKLGGGVNSGARVSACGSGRSSGSGSGSRSGGVFEELTAKRPCYETSHNNSGSDASNPAHAPGFVGFFPSSSAGVAAAAAEQQQGPHAAQLGAWFASQQRQQQQLQLQLQANFQMQQQVQMQIQQQVAAHMSMQQAAGRVVHMQQPALPLPSAVGSPEAAGIIVLPPETGLPFAGAYSSSCSAAAAAAAAAMAAVAASAAYNVGLPCEQLQQLDLQLRRSSSPVARASPTAAAAATACAAGAGLVGGSLLLGLQQQHLQPAPRFGSSTIPQGSCSASPRACDHVVPDLDPHFPPGHQLQQQAAAAAAAAACSGGMARAQCDGEAFAMRQLCLQASPLQPASAAEIDSLLTKAGQDMFALDELAAGADLDEDALAACGVDGGGDALGGDACSGGGNSSLCESVADELAVAGLEANDAPGYYMLGGAGSPRPSQQQQQQQQAAAVAAAVGGAGIGAGGRQGLAFGDGMQGTMAGAACGNCGLAGANGFKVAEEPCENSFAHMFDFY